MSVSSAELSRFVNEAGFIFRGKVAHQSPAARHSTSPPTVAAEIEEILLSTDVLRGLLGKIVTVVGEHAAPMEGGESLLFFTNCLVLADHVVVREVGHVRASQEAERQVIEAIGERAERPLRERIATAELIVEGEVTASSPADPNAVQKSEHDPNWGIARVAVASVVKGSAKTKAVEVLFANSKDIAWHKSPKLHQGLRGIFLLHPVKQADRPAQIDRLVYRATDPLDFLPAERLPEIKQALTGGKGNSAKGNSEKGGR